MEESGEEFTSSVSPKGQITLPAEIRRRLGIKPKGRVVITIKDGVVMIAPLTSRLERYFMSAPALKRPMSWSELTEAAHEERAREAASEGL